MNKPLIYKSTGKNLFDVWRIFLIGTPILTIVLFLIGLKFFICLTIALLINLAFAYVSISKKNAEIKREGKTIFFTDKEKKLSLEGIQKIETWWNYDIGISSNELNSNPINSSKAHSNKINIYAEIITDEGHACIYEQIVLSSKFPNNHQYKHDRYPENTFLYKIWDVDKCIEKLELSEFIKQVNKRSS